MQCRRLPAGRLQGDRKRRGRGVDGVTGNPDEDVMLFADVAELVSWDVQHVQEFQVCLLYVF